MGNNGEECLRHTGSVAASGTEKGFSAEPGRVRVGQNQILNGSEADE